MRQDTVFNPRSAFEPRHNTSPWLINIYKLCLWPGWRRSRCRSSYQSGCWTEWVPSLCASPPSSAGPPQICWLKTLRPQSWCFLMTASSADTCYQNRKQKQSICELKQWKTKYVHLLWKFSVRPEWYRTLLKKLKLCSSS